MEDFEKLGVFYLGRAYDMETKKAEGPLVLYDSRDLVTHAVCVGMTGSGKTGLCLSLIEEAAIDGVPSILIDPKGDLANLLLTFPELRPDDFLPWINQKDAQKKGLSPEEYAANQADLWKAGLAEWGQSGERIRRLRDAAEFVIYTPGSNAGIPVSITKSFAAPGQAVLDDNELLQERISTVATSLLSLVGIQADPVQSREHILISTILHNAWRQGQDLDLPTLISQVQAPPVTRVGVLELESFYPTKDRFGLVMALNNLLAAPGFGAWMEGVPLEAGEILYTPQGKPRVAIFYIAHLSDGERMFFVSLLLNQILGWMRTQSGTTSLRAIVYMDEIFGYFPPIANPPSKRPLLTLLKQARAYGLGVVLATQNPVDLDYKGLANTGTWFIGRLQTERDKARVLDGLEGVAATSGTGFDRQKIDQILSRLSSRVFLLNNVHEDVPQVFQTRWAMSYLRGPLTREQIRQLMRPVAAPQPAERLAVAPEPAVAAPITRGAGEAAPPEPAVAAPITRGAGEAAPPALPAGISQVFIPVRGNVPAGSVLRYAPRLLGAAKVRFTDVKTGVDLTQDIVLIAPIKDEVIPVRWENAEPIDWPVSELDKFPAPAAQFDPLPPAAGQTKAYAGWQRDFIAYLYSEQKLDLLRSPNLGQVSRPGESERDFRIRLQQVAREQRDAAVERLRAKYASEMASLQERLRRAQQAVEREQAQARQQQMQTAISFGATLLSAFVGRKAVSLSSLGRATTAARGVGRTMKEVEDIGRAAETVESLQARLAELEAELKAETEELTAKIDPLGENLETLTIRPKKTDITVQLLALAWEPFWQGPQGDLTRAWR